MSLLEGDSQQGQEIFSSPQHTDQMCGPPSLLSNAYAYGGLFPKEKSSQGVKQITHFDLVPRSAMVELYFQFPMSSWHSA
jgi:hypothetical protein